MQCDVAESASELCANYEYAAAVDQQTISILDGDEAAGRGRRDPSDLHALHVVFRPAALRLCGCSGRRATNYCRRCGCVQMGILRLLEVSRGVSAWRRPRCCGLRLWMI